MLLAAGTRFGGYALFVKDGRLTYEYNLGGMTPDERYVIVSDWLIAPGRRILRFEFHARGDVFGAGRLLTDGDLVAEQELKRTWPMNPATGGLTCGRDEGSPVSNRCALPFAFTGTIHRVVFDLGDSYLGGGQRRDHVAETRATLAED